jgi:hypothetical protein
MEPDDNGSKPLRPGLTRPVPRNGVAGAEGEPGGRE